MNRRILLLAGGLAASLASPAFAGSAKDEAALGSLLGGVVGAVVGNSYNGHQGAAVGAVIGATAGAYIAVDDDDRKRHYRDNRGYRGHGHDRHRYRQPQYVHYGRQPVRGHAYGHDRYGKHHRHHRYCDDD